MTWLIRAALAGLALAAGLACDIVHHDPELPEECKGDASLLTKKKNNHESHAVSAWLEV